MSKYDEAFAERCAQEDRLNAAGIQTDGGGVDMITGAWDVFAYPNDDVYAVKVSSVEQVDALIREFSSGS